MKFLIPFAIAVFGLLPSAFAQSAVPTTSALFANQYPLTRGILASDFPADLVTLETRFSEIDNTEISPLLRMQRAFSELTSLRKKYAPKMQYARADMSALVVLSLADFYDVVMRREGAEICGGFATDGAGALYTVGAAPSYALELDRQAAAYFSAVVTALEDPDVVGPATDADWKVVMGRIVADGHPASYVASIASGRVSDADLCPALSAFMHAMVEVTPDVAHRVRADFIQSTTGY
jgi:hypothetical protein